MLVGWGWVVVCGYVVFSCWLFWLGYGLGCIVCSVGLFGVKCVVVDCVCVFCVLIVMLFSLV